MYYLKTRRLSELEAAFRVTPAPAGPSQHRAAGAGPRRGQRAPMSPVDLPTSAKPRSTGLNYFCPPSFCQTFKILINPNSDPRITGEDGWGNGQPLTFPCICPATVNLLKNNWGGTCSPAPVPARHPFTAFPKLKVSPPHSQSSVPKPQESSSLHPPPPLQKPAGAEHLLNDEVEWGKKRGSPIQQCQRPNCFNGRAGNQRARCIVLVNFMNSWRGASQ